MIFRRKEGEVSAVRSVPAQRCIGIRKPPLCGYCEIGIRHSWNEKWNKA